mgnify:FL=1
MTMRNPYQRKAASNAAQKNSSATDQYRIFIESIVQQAKVYALYQEGWALCATPSGQQTLAVWQSKSLAQLLQKGNWGNYQVEGIDLIEFIEKMIPFIRENGKILSINLTPEGQNVLVSGDKFLIDLKEDLYSVQLTTPDVFKSGLVPLPRKIRIHEKISS